MSRHDLSAVSTIVYLLHKELHSELSCDAADEDAVDDHDQELALAGQIIMDLRRDGLTIAKKRSDTGRPRVRR